MMLSLWLDIGSAACISGSEPPAGSVPRAAAQGAKSDQAYTKQRQAGRLWHRGEGRGRNRDRAGRIAHVERGEACAVVASAMPYNDSPARTVWVVPGFPCLTAITFSLSNNLEPVPERRTGGPQNSGGRPPRNGNLVPRSLLGWTA